MSCIQNYTLTEYHKLYSDTYWGQGGVHGEDEIIIENRNRFATEYNLKSVINKGLTFEIKYQEQVGIFEDLNEIKNNFKKKIDGDKYNYLRRRDVRAGRHIEYYKTIDKKIIAVFSPYGKCESMVKMAGEAGYSLIYPIYSLGGNTFVKEIITTSSGIIQFGEKS